MSPKSYQQITANLIWNPKLELDTVSNHEKRTDLKVIKITLGLAITLGILAHLT